MPTEQTPYTPPRDAAPADTPVPAAASSTKIDADRERLLNAESTGKRWWTYVQLSGPGWLQSAITLGGGSLAGALFLGLLGGTEFIWLQLVAILCGVVMLSAIAYVTLSTGRRPFEAINREINPALGWGWLIATSLANMIWCMPQFSLAYDAIDLNLTRAVTGERLGTSAATQWIVTAILFVCAGGVVLLNVRQGKTAKLFDLVLKTLIGMVVICFFGVVAVLAFSGQLDFGAIVAGLIPNPSSWNEPSSRMRELIGSLPPAAATYWTDRLVSEQRNVMIAAAATAVGINMTFLLPYSMLARGWDKPFRGLARFDLSTGMAIPYVLVTSCVVIAAATTFHGRVDESLLSTDPAVVVQSPLYAGVAGQLAKQNGGDPTPEMVAATSSAERHLAATLVKRNARQLSETLTPLLGQFGSNLVFGLGVFGMGFSTIIILMLINGYVFRELMNDPDGVTPFVIGCLVAGVTGAMWVVVWTDPDAKFYLAIVASTFGAMLLPIAYVTFWLMMNSRRILGPEKPTGTSAIVWNVLMSIAVVLSIVAAFFAIKGKIESPDTAPWLANTIIGIAVAYAIVVAIGFFMRKRSANPESANPDAA